MSLESITSSRTSRYKLVFLCLYSTFKLYMKHYISASKVQQLVSCQQFSVTLFLLEDKLVNKLCELFSAAQFVSMSPNQMHELMCEAV